MLSGYQIVELCEWLYEDSKDKRHRELALKWSKDYQVIQPMFAWAYAIEAKYTRNTKDKIRALAFAQHLDPQSARIAGFSKRDKAKASKWMKKHNPFKEKVKSTSDTI